MSDTTTASRRRLLITSATAATGLLAGPVISGWSQIKREVGQNEEVSPAEDLMREHGVLNRVLLIYDEAANRLERNQGEVPPDVLHRAADVIRRFIEDYHEQLEEKYLFPRFDKANQLRDLVATLPTQHDAGRKTTQAILHLATDQTFRDARARRELVGTLRQFTRMYRPHEAREDTVVFPAFRKIVTANEYDGLGEDFEKQEQRLFDEDGFESMVDRVAGLEKQLGIYDLAQFTSP